MLQLALCKHIAHIAWLMDLPFTLTMYNQIIIGNRFTGACILSYPMNNCVLYVHSIFH